MNIAHKILVGCLLFQSITYGCRILFINNTDNVKRIVAFPDMGFPAENAELILYPGKSEEFGKAHIEAHFEYYKDNSDAEPSFVVQQIACAGNNIIEMKTEDIENMQINSHYFDIKEYESKTVPILDDLTVEDQAAYGG